MRTVRTVAKSLTFEDVDLMRLRKVLGFADRKPISPGDVVNRIELMRRAVADAADHELCNPPVGLVPAIRTAPAPAKGV